MDWDHLRYFLELARASTLAAAARRLGVEHTTVARRIQALEKQLGTPLFAREAAGHRLTEAGRHLLPGVPYHALGEAHRRMAEGTGTQSSYGKSSYPGLAPLVAKLAGSTMHRG